MDVEKELKISIFNALLCAHPIALKNKLTRENLISG
jgi:hypothetical protein